MSKAMIMRVLGYFTPYLWKATSILLCILGVSLCGIIAPLLIRNIIDTAIPNSDMPLLTLMAISMLLVSLLSGFITVAQNYLSNVIGQNVMYDIRNHMYSHIQGMHLGFFMKVKTGEAVSRLNDDVGGIQNVVTGTFVSIVANCANLITTVAMIFYLSMPLALLSVFLLPLFVFPARRVGSIRKALTRDTQNRRADLAHILQETLGTGGYILMKIFGRESLEMEKFRQSNEAIMRLQIRQALVGRWYFMIVGLFGTLGPALVYWLGGWLVIRETMTLGTVVAFVAYLARLYGPASSLASVHVDVTTSMALFERIFQYMDTKSEITDASDAYVLNEIRGEVSFQNVSFDYGNGNNVLNEVSFNTGKGKMTAIVGHSGAGKTTLTYMMPRFYDPISGRILIDGYDIRNVTMGSLRKQIGIVTQDTFVYHDSIRQNLMYANASAGSADLEEACRSAQLYKTIMDMPNGFDTVVGENGYRLSGGERQRLSIARIILADCRIVVLDEATSSLDSVSENLIQAALKPLFADRTVIVIAHRLSTVIKADEIIVLDNGRVVEKGTHEELIEISGVYSSLYKTQFKTH